MKFYHFPLRKSIESTYAYLSELVDREPLPEATVLNASYQMAGRGQGSNSWYSSPGANLLPSVFFGHLGLPLENYWRISEITALAVWETVAYFTQAELLDLRIKWPNDIMYKGHKVAGILIGNRLLSGEIDSTVIGVGINVNETAFPDTIPPAHSLYTITQKRFDLDEVLNFFLDRLGTWREQILHSVVMEQVHKEYNKLLYQRGICAPYRETKTGFCFDAVIEEVNSSGLLLLCRESSTVTPTYLSCRVGDIEYIRPQIKS